MKQLIFDKLRRQWLFWVACCLVFLIVGMLVSLVATAFSAANWFPLFWLLCLSGWQSELGKGYGRVALTLPLTTRQIGRVLWFLSVGIPMLGFAFFSGLGILITASYSNTTRDLLYTWVLCVLSAGLLFGSLFWISSGAPLNPSKRWQRRFASQFYNVVFWLVLVGGAYLLYKSKWGHEIKYAIACLFGLIFTVLGWFRAEGLIVDYGERRQVSLDSSTAGGIFRPPVGHGGIPFLCSSHAIRCLGLLLILTTGLVAITVFSKGGLSWSHISGILPQAQIWVFFLVFGQTVAIVQHLKFLRTLPIKPRTLATIILSLALLPILLLGGTIAALIAPGAGGAAALSLLKGYILGLAPACVLTTALIWHDEKRFGRIVLVALVFIVSGIPLVYQLTTGVWNSGHEDLSLWMVVGFPLLVFAAAIFAISYLLEQNDMTYRIKPEALEKVF